MLIVKLGPINGEDGRKVLLARQTVRFLIYEPGKKSSARSTYVLVYTG